MSKNNLKQTDASKLSARNWFNICLFGFVGQIAWNLENMYYNTFMYNTVYDGGAAVGKLSSMDAITLMVNLSAITAVVTTFIMGNLSDRKNKRKIFICGGYLVWGVITASFGFITKTNVSMALGIINPLYIVGVTAMVVVVMDCVMTFVGSTSNDSAFNAWVTDITTPKNRPTVESVLSILPMFSMVVVMLSGGFITTLGDGDISEGYKNYFLILGVLVVSCGIIGMFTLTESRKGPKTKNKNYWKDIFYGFKPSVMKENIKLYLTLTAVCINNIAFQCFLPFLFIYLDHKLGFKIESLIGYLSLPVILIAVVVLVLAVAGIIGLGKLTDKVGKKNLVFVGEALMAIGLIAVSFAENVISFLIFALPFFAGYILLCIILNSAVRDHTPKDKTGLFQGVRMIFCVLIPMLVGPRVGTIVSETIGSGSYVDASTGLTQSEPCAEMFFVAGIIVFFAFIPLIILRKKGIDVVENEDK